MEAEPNFDQPAKEEEEKDQKKSLGQLFGIEIRAPKEMKNPIWVLIGMVAANVLLLILLRGLF